MRENLATRAREKEKECEDEEEDVRTNEVDRPIHADREETKTETRAEKNDATPYATPYRCSRVLCWRATVTSRPDRGREEKTGGTLSVLTRCRLNGD